MDRVFKVGDVVVLKSDRDQHGRMTVCQVGANFCNCLKAGVYGVSEVVDISANLLPFPFETLKLLSEV